VKRVCQNGVQNEQDEGESVGLEEVELQGELVDLDDMMYL